MATPLLNPKRYITTTDPSTNKSTLSTTHFPEEIPPTLKAGHQYARLAWSNASPPLDVLNSEKDISAFSTRLDEASKSGKSLVATPLGGVSVLYGDTAPGAESPMHANSSVDFIVLIQGELELELEDGTVKLLAVGDLVVQRGTVHKWRNPSRTHWARVMAVTLGNAKAE